MAERYLCITIDVEPDCTPTWHYSNPLTFTGVRTGIAEILQPLFNRYGIKPTYLINNVVLEDQESVEIFKTLPGEFELGTHLHPEFIAPAKQYSDYAGKKGEANCCFYPPEVEYEKLRSITDLFTSQFGYKPVSFRAGRFSCGSNTIRSLQQLGYAVDTSVTPHVCWKDRSREKPVDFTAAPEQPYFIDENSLLKEDPHGKLLQVPVSIIPVRNNFYKEAAKSLFGFRRKMKLTRPLWLRPVYADDEEMISIAESLTGRYANRPRVVLNMMFHNVEVMAGLSPYTQDQKQVEDYLKTLEKFFQYTNGAGIQSKTLKEVYARYKA